MKRKIGIIGLGYVGMPLALAFARKFPIVVGFDINSEKIELFKGGVDATGEGHDQDLKETTLDITADPKVLKKCDFYVVGVPTPIDLEKRPDLSLLESACKMLGASLKKGDIVVFESTVYPGVTEQFCGKWLSEASGLKCGVDFKLGYSPERINPGDKKHTLEKITKIVSGQDAETLQIVAEIYSEIIEAGVYKTSSIMVAEAAKVIENTQRDLNIALMNELAIIFDLVGINSKEVFDAAATKWNFLRYSPGLVGGHCIGVDPFYLTTLAERLGYRPQVILAGRRINDNMGKFVAQKLVKLLARTGVKILNSKVGILGLTFKENVSDLRNSRVPDIINELRDFGVQTVVHDPYADSKSATKEYGLTLSELSDFKNLDAVVFAVPHKAYLELPKDQIFSMLKSAGVFVDVKAVFNGEDCPKSITYWSL
jgi:UDP-N-acetyl-D-galactosamine dehydrogenase